MLLGIFVVFASKMGSLDPALLDNPSYRKFLLRALPLFGDLGIRHFYMSSLLAAAKEDGSGFVQFRMSHEPSTWTNIFWVCPLISRNKNMLMSKLERFILSLLQFAKPEMKVIDAEWGDTDLKPRQFVGTLVVWPWIYLPGEQAFDQLIHVRLMIRRRKKAASVMKHYVKLELKFERFYISVRSLCSADSEISSDHTVILICSRSHRRQLQVQSRKISDAHLACQIRSVLVESSVPCIDHATRR